MGALYAISIGVIIVLVSTLLPKSGGRARRLGDRWLDRWKRSRKLHQRQGLVRAHQRRAAREIADARAKNELVAVRHSGRNPTTVDWDGARQEQQWYFEDALTYQRTCMHGRADIRRSFVANPPPLWTRRPA